MLADQTTNLITKLQFESFSYITTKNLLEI